MAATAAVRIGTGTSVSGPVVTATDGRPIFGRREVYGVGSCGGWSVGQAAAGVQWLRARQARDDYANDGPVQLWRIFEDSRATSATRAANATTATTTTATTTIATTTNATRTTTATTTTATTALFTGQSIDRRRSRRGAGGSTRKGRPERFKTGRSQEKREKLNSSTVSLRYILL